MVLSADTIRSVLEANLSAEHVTVEGLLCDFFLSPEIVNAQLCRRSAGVDVSAGCGTSFEVVVVSPLFEGKGLLQRHRLVNDALKNEMPQIHAFTQKTYSPAQWKALQQASA